MEINEILLMYGNKPEGATVSEHLTSGQRGSPLVEMAFKLAESAGLALLIGDRKKRIGLKPNLVVSRPAENGATTHPEIAAGLISYLKKNGFNNIVILEGSWTGDTTTKAFFNCGYKSLARETGVELIDTQTDRYELLDCSGLKIEICKSALEVDYMINLPVLKGHCQTHLTCALKNNKGLISNREKRRFHVQGLHKPIACLNTKIRNDFILVDGICGDPDFEEGGNPLYGGRLFAARDPVLCDAFAAQLMGLDLQEVPYIRLAEKLGVGKTGPAHVRELNKISGISSPSPRYSAGKVRQLTGLVRESDACSACYSSLVFALSRLDSHERSLTGELCIGQGFRGKTGKIGIGQCASSFNFFCPGCPPTGSEILSFLRKQI